jgi:hypothetical protein
MFQSEVLPETPGVVGALERQVLAAGVRIPTLG